MAHRRRLPLTPALSRKRERVAPKAPDEGPTVPTKAGDGIIAQSEPDSRDEMSAARTT